MYKYNAFVLEFQYGLCALFRYSEGRGSFYFELRFFRLLMVIHIAPMAVNLQGRYYRFT